MAWNFNSQRPREGMDLLRRLRLLWEEDYRIWLLGKGSDGRRLLLDHVLSISPFRQGESDKQLFFDQSSKRFKPTNQRMLVKPPAKKLCKFADGTEIFGEEPKEETLKITTVIPDRPKSFYTGNQVDDVLDGPKAWPRRHGITGWINSQKVPDPDQALRVGRDVKKSRLHRDEVLELEHPKGLRCLRVKGNTGGWRPLRANEDFLEWMKREGSVDNREVVDALSAEPEEQRFYLQTHADSKRNVYFDGEEWQLAEEREYFPGQVIKRGRGRNKTEEERLQDRDSFEKVRSHCEKILKVNRAWSHTDPPEDVRILTLSNGEKVKVNLSNQIFKLILIDIDIHNDNYDTKKKLFGDDYERLRKKELMGINVEKKIPTTKFTMAQIECIKSKDGRAVFAHVMTDKPRWYPLDMNTHETYREAIDAVMWQGIHSALDQTPMWNNPRASKAKHTKAFRDVFNRWKEYFRTPNIYILDLRNPGPMAAAILEQGLSEEAEPRTTEPKAFTQAIASLKQWPEQ